jgi:hypothetical protein
VEEVASCSVLCSILDLARLPAVFGEEELFRVDDEEGGLPAAAPLFPDEPEFPL